MNQPLSTNVNNEADEPAPKVQPIAAPHLPWTADEIDQAVLEADEAWRKAGKITRYSEQLVHALAARLPSAVHTQPVGQADWRAATEADRTKPMLAVRWRAEDGPWIYPTSIQAESLLAHDIERCQVKDITTPVLTAKPALFVSAQQLEALQTIRREYYAPEGGHGRYLPVRSERGGLFTQALYTHSEPVEPVNKTGLQSAIQALSDNTMRVERIVMLDAMLGDHYHPAPGLQSMLEEAEDTLLSMFPGMPDWLRKALSENTDFEDAFIEWVNQDAISGLAVQFATPVMKWDTGRDSCSYSWGHYTTRWFHSDSLGNAIALALDWVESIRQSEKSKRGRST